MHTQDLTGEPLNIIGALARKLILIELYSLGIIILINVLLLKFRAENWTAFPQAQRLLPMELEEGLL